MTGDTVLSYFFERKSPSSYKRGSVVVDANIEPDGVWFVKSGYVRQCAKSAKGQEVSFHIYKPGAVFPLMWLLSESKNRYTYDVMTESELIFAPTREFMDLLDKHPELISHFSKRFILGMDGLLTRLESLVVDDVETRILKLFAYFGRSFGNGVDSDSIHLTFPLTHFEIATWIGAARETTTLAIRRLTKKRLLSAKGKYYKISSLKRLTALTE